MEQTLKLTIAYDGTHFSGWQRQKNARTVQAVLEETLRKIFHKKISVVGASRTDSGVHAEGQVAHVTISSRGAVSVLHRALNALLPADIVIRSIRPAPSRFHARYSALAKHYRYTIWNHPERPLFDRAYVLHVPIPLDVGAMRQAAQQLRGRHDFKAFHSSGRTVSSTVRTLHLLNLQERGGKIILHTEAEGFLYHMVRRIVGLLVEIGKGRYPPSVVPGLLHGTRHVIPPTAPAKGLCLCTVFYAPRKTTH